MLPVSPKKQQSIEAMHTAWRDTAERKRERDLKLAALDSGEVNDAGHPFWLQWRSYKKGGTLLHYAASQSPDSDRVVPFLLNEGLDVNAEDENGSTPLFRVASQPAPQAMAWTTWLVTAGARIDHVNNQGMTPVVAMLQGGKEQVVRFLVQAGAANRPETQSLGLMEECVRTGNADLLTDLWEHYGQPEGEDLNRMLMAAACNNRPNLIRLMIARGADVHWLDDRHYTCLHAACENAFLDANVVFELVAAGCDPLQTVSAGPNAGKAALDLSSLNVGDKYEAILLAIAKGRQVQMEHRLDHVACSGSKMRF